MTEALRDLGAHVIPYIPDRFDEGYGLNAPAISRLHADGATLLAAVDCGTSSVDEVAHACSLGMDVVIVDHHLPADRLPDALALVNPRVSGSDGWELDLASAGLVYYLLLALYDALGKPFPEQRFLDLAGLGTVCDMAPLHRVNRPLAIRGLEAVQNTDRCGLRALMQVSAIDSKRIDTEALSFMLGPRINAAGRLAHARLSLDLLLCDDPETARSLARNLDSLNRQRQRQTATALDLAWDLLSDDDGDAPLLMAGHADIPPGVAGLVAAKIADALYRPAVVYQKGETQSRGSGRSIPEFDVAAAMRSCEELFVRVGGHQQAAGFTADNASLPAIKERLVAHAEERLAGLDLTPVLEVDGEVGLRELGREEIRWLGKLGPYGMGNPEPIFLSRNVAVVESRIVGSDGKHLRLKLKDGYAVWPAIGFGLGGLYVERGRLIDVVFSLSRDKRDGSLQLTVHDLAASI
jgi:single-stranded-DNA-specific exonuclease